MKHFKDHQRPSDGIEWVAEGIAADTPMSPEPHGALPQAVGNPMFELLDEGLLPPWWDD